MIWWYQWLLIRELNEHCLFTLYYLEQDILFWLENTMFFDVSGAWGMQGKLLKDGIKVLQRWRKVKMPFLPSQPS